MRFIVERFTSFSPEIEFSQQGFYATIEGSKGAIFSILSTPWMNEKEESLWFSDLSK